MKVPDLTPRTTTVSSIDLSLRVQLHATGWQTAISRPPKIDVKTLANEPPKVSIVSFRIGDESVKTRSFFFPPSGSQGDRFDVSKKTTKAAARRKPNARSTTRIQPPSDIVKLEDRLFYVLQPPLEIVLSREFLEFPFQPFPYQYEGVAFLYPRHSAILADEMGLGKTMQAITAIRLLLRSGEVSRVLLVCPKPLVTNWKAEFEMWAPEIPLTIIDGNQTRRNWQWQLVDAPVKIANYEILLRDQNLLGKDGIPFDLVVLDEAQRIKNRVSSTSQIVRSISRSRSWALTGTPIENSSEDLVGIFEFLSPGFLTSGMSARLMRKSVRDHILRRTKDMVLTDLPPKMFRDANVSLTPEQFTSYQAAEEQGVLRLNEMGKEITIQHVFELVLRLKQICNFDPATGTSCKLERLEADLEEVAASNKKAIVFSQWVKTLDQVRDRLQRFGPLEYHGKIPIKKRDGVLKRFKDDPASHVLLMSYGAGSVGLNLQFCSYVFLFDRWWNPAVEDQAINRAHRIGVTGPVTVTRMLAVGTIEERINEVLEKKRELFAAILSQTGTPRSAGLTRDEVFGLFNLRVPVDASEKAA